MPMHWIPNSWPTVDLLGISGLSRASTLARVDFYMKCYIRRPSRAPSRSIAHG